MKELHFKIVVVVEDYADPEDVVDKVKDACENIKKLRDVESCYSVEVKPGNQI